MQIIDYQSIRLLSDIEESELIEWEFTKEELERVGFLSLMIGVCLLIPETSHAFDHVLQKTKEIEIEPFFMDGERKFRKLFKEIDYRSTMSTKKLKNFSKSKIRRKLVEKTILNTQKIDVVFSTPLIDLTPLLTSLFQGVKPIEKTRMVEQLMPSQKGLLLRGGITWFLLGKVADRFGKRVNKWATEKLDLDGEEVKKKKTLNRFFEFLRNNPLAISILSAWFIINRKQNNSTLRKVIHQTFPSSIAKTIVGEKSNFKRNLLKTVSFRQPYIYLVSVLVFLIRYRKTILKLFKRELTTSEAIAQITTNFLQSNSELFGKMYDMSKDFTPEEQIEILIYKANNNLFF